MNKNIVFVFLFLNSGLLFVSEKKRRDLPGKTPYCNTARADSEEYYTEGNLSGREDEDIDDCVVQSSQTPVFKDDGDKSVILGEQLKNTNVDHQVTEGDHVLTGNKDHDSSVIPHVLTGGVQAVCDDRISSQALQEESSKIKSNDFCCSCVVQ